MKGNGCCLGMVILLDAFGTSVLAADYDSDAAAASDVAVASPLLTVVAVVSPLLTVFVAVAAVAALI